jgi:hypothetical protein
MSKYKLMKPHFNLVLSFVIVFMVFNTNGLFAQPKKSQTKAFLDRTDMIIAKAKEAITAGKVYTGEVLKASYHQSFARMMLRDEKFLRAIHHSNRARALSYNAIKANKGLITKDMETTKDEQELIINQPDVKTLDGEIIIPKTAQEKEMMNK